ncbi:hypothetical protein Ssi03_53400 [Sphaerisporangium siamense]|uniref:Putative ABC transport system permease protein n=1 Tax=Sphaerisporangium siamense TaxID=795645 RepID=A0A7W7D6P0_9ACTN|nr:FtsX-like permease family protein [Sphaerisporangium siamense]MBB4701282.1 putative ABC transport system permease protein [Sphaerisporangium siamense]GII87350.1 hypothetical protein Ssi03_53400 [Sphaerisporangium siamense]
MSGARAALRISRRDAWRAKGRSSLVVAMVGLPVLAITAMLTLLVTFDVSPQEGLAAQLGSADALIRTNAWSDEEGVEQDHTGTYVTSTGSGRPGKEPTPARPWTAEEVARLLPAGSKVVPWTGSAEYYRSSRWLGDASVSELDLREPMTRGLFVLRDGRLPGATDEVVVSPDFAAHGVTAGSTLTLLGNPRAYRVVGTVTAPQAVRTGLVVGLPGGRLAVHTPSTEWLVDTSRPVTWDDIKRFNARGSVVVARAMVMDPPPEALESDAAPAPRSGLQMLLSGMGVMMIVLEVVLLAGPAFAVGIRRRRRELALIAAQGASAAQLRRVVLADGLVLGGLAAVLGLLGGLGLARATLAVGLWTAFVPSSGPFEVPWVPVAGVAVLGLVSALLAAVVPARQAARADVVAVLAGRRGAVAARRGWPVAGLVMTVAGLALTIGGTRQGALWVTGPHRSPGVWATSYLGVIAGSLLAMLGLVAMTPMLVGLAARVTVRLPLPFKLAGRDAARNRGRTAPAVAAVMAATAGLVAVSILSASEGERYARQYRPEWTRGSLVIQGTSGTGAEMPLVRAAVEQALPGVPTMLVYTRFTDAGRSRNVAVVEPRCADPSACAGQCDEPEPCGRLYGRVMVGGADLLRYLVGREDPASAAALADGKAVLLAALARDGKATLSISESDALGRRSARRVQVPAVTVNPERRPAADALLPLSLAATLELDARPSELVIDPAVHQVTSEEEARITRRVAAVTSLTYITLEQGPRRNELPFLVLMGAAVILVLGGTFAATGLAAADARPDVATLGAVGAPPRLRRLVTAGQAWFVAATGVTLGALVGLVPGIATTWRMNVFPGYGGWVSYTPVSRIPTPVVVIPWPSIVALVVLLPVVAALVAGLFARTRIPLARRME